jgi:hypothetical protein
MDSATGNGAPGLWDSTYAVFGQTSANAGAVGLGYHAVSGGSLSSITPGVAWRRMVYRADSHNFFAQGDNQRMIINNSGNVGIGTTSPSGALCHIDGSVSGSPGTSRRYTSAGQDGGTANWSGVGISLRVSSGIWGTEIFLTSDSRIKTNVQDLNDLEALTILRQLQPKRYTYKDTIAKGETPVYGFIAQEVAEVLDYAVDTKSDYIPNIYQLCTIENNIITSSQPMNIINITSGQLQIYYPFNETEKQINVNILNIIDSYTVAIEPITDITGGNVFVYGELVNDFNVLKKDAIWTITTAALQEMDRELQATKNELQELKTFLQNKFPGEI